MAALELRKASKTCLTFVPIFSAKTKVSVSGTDYDGYIPKFMMDTYDGYIPKFSAKYTKTFSKNSENGASNLRLSGGSRGLVLASLTS